MTSGKEPDGQPEPHRRDPASADLDAFNAIVQAANAEAQRLQAIVEQTNTTASVVDEMVKQLRAPLQIYEDMEAATRAAIEQDRQLQAATQAADDHRRLVADLLTNLTEFVERESVQTLMQHGWFPDLDLTASQIQAWAELFDDHPQQANEALCDRFRELLDDIEAKVKGAFPHRSEILSEAFHAHRQGHYCLSVLGFLTQVDGFFHDIWDKSLFVRGDREKVGGQVGQMQNELAREMVRVLLESDWPLIMARDKRPDDFTGLNRHQVLHGEVTDFGTEEYSLKALSLLNYCVFVLPNPEHQPTEPNGSE